MKCVADIVWERIRSTATLQPYKRFKDMKKSTVRN